MHVSHRKVSGMGNIERWMWLADVALRDKRTEEQVKAELMGREVVVREKVRKLIKHEGKLWDEGRKGAGK